MDSGRVFGRVAFTHLHRVEQTEIVAEFADFLLRMERITWAFCTAYRDDRLVVSLRSSSTTARCGQVLRKLIGKSGAAGGHNHMAAGFIDMKQWKPETRETKRRELVQGLLRAVETRTNRRTAATHPPLEPQPLVAQSAVDSKSSPAGSGDANA